MSTSINVHNSFNMVDATTGGKITYEGGIEIGSNTTESSVGTGLAVGKGANVSAVNGIAIGGSSFATASGAVALGQNITADQADSVFMKHRALDGSTVSLAGFRSGSNELVAGSDNTTVSGNVEFLGNVQFTGDVVLDGNIFGLPDSVGSFSAGTTGLTPSTPTNGDIVLAGTLNTDNGGTGLTAIGTSDQILGVNIAGTALEYKSDINISGDATFGGDLVVGGNIMAEFINIQGNCIFSNDLTSSVCVFDGGAATIDGDTSVTVTAPIITLDGTANVTGNLTLDQQLFFTDGVVVGNVDTTSSSTTGVAIGNNSIVSSSGAVALGENIVANQVDGFFVKHRGPIAATINMAGFIAGTNELVEITSSRRFKENIRDLENVSAKFEQLRPVRYNPKEGHGDQREHIGLIAEEVNEVFPEFVTFDANTGETTGLMFDRMVSVLIQEIQSLKQRDAEKDFIIEKLREKCGI